MVVDFGTVAAVTGRHLATRVPTVLNVYSPLSSNDLHFSLLLEAQERPILPDIEHAIAAIIARQLMPVRWGNAGLLGLRSPARERRDLAFLATFSLSSRSEPLSEIEPVQSLCRGMPSWQAPRAEMRRRTGHSVRVWRRSARLRAPQTWAARSFAAHASGPFVALRASAGTP